MKRKRNDKIVFRIAKRLYLRPVIKEDLPLITLWINDPEITWFLNTVYPQTLQDEEDLFESQRKKKSTDLVFALVLRETHEMIGIMGLHSIDQVHRLGTTGSFIGRKDLWGKGYGYEAKMLLLDYAF